MTYVPVPRPGSPRAIAHGCTCPELANDHGQGMPGKDGTAWFLFSTDCPLHGGGDWRDQRTEEYPLEH